nr:hypothetical protein [Tanacetum cinerariifolium]
VGEIRGSSVSVVEWAGKEEVGCKRVGGKTGYWCYSTSFQNGREQDTVIGLGTLHVFLALLTETAFDFSGLCHASRFYTIVELELKVIHISVVCCGVGLEFALRNRVLLWRCLKIRVLWWTVLIDSSLVGLTVLIEIIALKTILVVVLLSRLSRWTHLIRNVLTVLNEIFDCCGLKLLDVIMKYGKIIFSSSEWTLIIAMV